jgi:hypothetical protein
VRKEFTYGLGNEKPDVTVNEKRRACPFFTYRSWIFPGPDREVGGAWKNDSSSAAVFGCPVYYERGIESLR